MAGKFDASSCIIDTSATHHVTGNNSWLFDTQKFDYPNGLPNGAKVVATLIGSVHLSDKITFTEVLHVPNLNCNVLFVSQLNDELHTIVHFDSNVCAI